MSSTSDGKHILLINPRNPLNYWNMEYMFEFLPTKALGIPLPSLTIAAMFPDDYALRLVDLNVRELTNDDIEWADMVLLTGMKVHRFSIDDVIRRVRGQGKLIGLGGPYATAHSEDVVDQVDILFIGEVEEIFSGFLWDYEHHTLKHVYEATQKPDVSLSPVPRYDLIDHRDYQTFSLQYSRGCPFNCEFCDVITIFGRKQRAKRIDQVLQELEAIYRTGHRGSVFIADDNLITAPRVTQLLQAISEWQAGKGYPFTLVTQGSVNMVKNDRLMDLLEAAGFTSIFIGIETPISASLIESQKTQNIGVDLRGVIAEFRRRGIVVGTGLMVGFDNDPEDVFEIQYQFVADTNIPNPSVSMLSAMKDTQLYERYRREGRLLRDADGAFVLTLEPNFQSRMGNERLKSGMLDLYRRLFTPSNHLKRMYNYCSSQKLPKSVASKFTMWQQGTILWKFVQGAFPSRYLFYTVKYGALMAARNPKLMESFLSNVLLGYHVHRLTEVLHERREVSSVS